MHSGKSTVSKVFKTTRQTGTNFGKSDSQTSRCDTNYIELEQNKILISHHNICCWYSKKSQ